MPESYYIGPAMATDWGERKPGLSRSLLARAVSDGANPLLDSEAPSPLLQPIRKALTNTSSARRHLLQLGLGTGERSQRGQCRQASVGVVHSWRWGQSGRVRLSVAPCLRSGDQLP